MGFVDLELFKKHVRADDFGDDDVYLEHLLGAAEAYVVDSTGRGVEELCVMGGGGLPVALVQAVLLLGGHWYNQREGVGGAQLSEVPFTVSALVKRFVRLGGVGN